MPAALEALARAAVPAWVDALAGQQKRTHDDLDLVVAEAECGRAQAALHALGYRHDPAVRPGLPARVVLRDPAARQIDIHPIRFDAAGDGRQPLGGGRWGATRCAAGAPPFNSATTATTRRMPATATTAA